MTDVMALVLNYNTCDLTIKCVNNLLGLSCGLSVLIVDNHSTDESYHKLCTEFKANDQVHVIDSGSNLGYARGNNLGIRHMAENFQNIKYVLLLNPDVTVDNPETIFALQSFLEKNDEYAIATTRIIYNKTNQNFSNSGWRFPSVFNMFFSGTIIGKLAKNNINDTYSNLPQNDAAGFIQVDIVTGCFFMAKLDCMLNIGLFDSRTFLYWEEAILSCRLKQSGKKEAVLLNGIAFHDHVKTDSSRYGSQKRLFLKKCFYDSKMVFISNYSGLKGAKLFFCKTVNSLDFFIKKIYYIVTVPTDSH